MTIHLINCHCSRWNAPWTPVLATHSITWKTNLVHYSNLNYSDIFGISKFESDIHFSFSVRVAMVLRMSIVVIVLFKQRFEWKQNKTLVVFWTLRVTLHCQWCPVIINTLVALISSPKKESGATSIRRPYSSSEMLLFQVQSTCAALSPL